MSVFDALINPVQYVAQNVFGYHTNNGQQAADSPTGGVVDFFLNPIDYVGSKVSGNPDWGRDPAKNAEHIIDPQGFAGQYDSSPSNTDENKYGVKPSPFNPAEYDENGNYIGPSGTSGTSTTTQGLYGNYNGQGGGGGGGGWRADTQGRYQQYMNQLNTPIDLNSPYLQQLQQQAGAGAAEQAKNMGLGGSPYAVNANEKARYMAGLNYLQAEQARRQGLQAQALQGYGQTGLGYGQQDLGYSQLGENRRQFNMNQAWQQHQAAVDAYNRRMAGHDAALGMIPFAGKAAESSANGQHSAY